MDYGLYMLPLDPLDEIEMDHDVGQPLTQEQAVWLLQECKRLRWFEREVNPREPKFHECQFCGVRSKRAHGPGCEYAKRVRPGANRKR